ncbi:hypothetical protein [Methylosinus sporium]|uniref:hypothetical protein n=1 Tax=Methylosinus sporium TaxID=428 RepID=UPI0011B20B03|nr:hypothetical protein [Methylosinus sporium]
MSEQDRQWDESNKAAKCSKWRSARSIEEACGVSRGLEAHFCNSRKYTYALSPSIVETCHKNTDVDAQKNM